MKEVALSVDIFCVWDITPPVYRIYVDGDMLTERTYIWNNTEQYIREHIVVALTPGPHSIKIQSADTNFKNFSIGNFMIDRRPANLVANQFTVN